MIELDTDLVVLDPNEILKNITDTKIFTDFCWSEDWLLDIFTGKGLDNLGIENYFWIDATDNKDWSVSFYQAKNQYLYSNLRNIETFPKITIKSKSGFFVILPIEDIYDLIPEFSIMNKKCIIIQKAKDKKVQNISQIKYPDKGRFLLGLDWALKY